MNRIADLQDKDQNVAIDVDFIVNGSTVVVTDFDLFLPDEKDEGGWKQVKDVKRAREAFEKFNCKDLIATYLENLGRFSFDEVKA